jgi:hypothetical protein
LQRIGSKRDYIPPWGCHGRRSLGFSPITLLRNPSLRRHGGMGGCRGSNYYEVEPQPTRMGGVRTSHRTDCRARSGADTLRTGERVESSFLLMATVLAYPLLNAFYGWACITFKCGRFIQNVQRMPTFGALAGGIYPLFNNSEYHIHCMFF